MSKHEIAAFDMAAAFHGRCGEIEDFIGRSVRPIVERRANQAETEQDEFQAYAAALLRAVGWLRSFMKLNEPGDFQAIVAGTRALFEIAIDLTLIDSDDDRYTYDKLRSWEISAKFTAAKRSLRFYDQTETEPPNAAIAWKAYLEVRESEVHAAREAYWRGRHPARWTGNNLRVDAEHADDADHQGFLEWYCVRYPSICWNTHGSGAAGFDGISADMFPGVAGLAFNEAFHFSLVIARKCLELVGGYDDISKERFERFERDSKLAASLKMLKLPPNLFV